MKSAGWPHRPYPVDALASAPCLQYDLHPVLQLLRQPRLVVIGPTPSSKATGCLLVSGEPQGANQVKFLRYFVIVGGVLALLSCSPQTVEQDDRLASVPFTAVQIDDAF